MIFSTCFMRYIMKFSMASQHKLLVQEKRLPLRNGNSCAINGNGSFLFNECIKNLFKYSTNIIE